MATSGTHTISLRIVGSLCKRTGGVQRAFVLVFPVHGTFVRSGVHDDGGNRANGLVLSRRGPMPACKHQDNRGLRSLFEALDRQQQPCNNNRLKVNNQGGKWVFVPWHKC